MMRLGFGSGPGIMGEAPSAPSPPISPSDIADNINVKSNNNSNAVGIMDAESTGLLLPCSPAKSKGINNHRALLLRRIRKAGAGWGLGYGFGFGGASATKAKILLSFCVFFVALLLFLHRIGPFMGWNRQHHPPLAAADFPSGTGYTVLINTWKRYSLLKKVVAHYAACSYTDAIHVIWSESEPPSDSLKAQLNKIFLSQTQSANKPHFKFEMNEEDNLNNRFKPITEPQNDAIFSVDDDVIIPCHTLDYAFTVWRTAPSTMVGFVPRMHWLQERKDGSSYYKYGSWWSVWWMGTYSMILSKAAFFHRKYLDMYTYSMPSSIRDYVTRERNCEDIAMSLLVANATGVPPIWVKGKVYEIGSFGISSLKGHSERRNRCLNDFISHYGEMPLVPTNMKAVDAQREWWW